MRIDEYHEHGFVEHEDMNETPDKSEEAGDDWGAALAEQAAAEKADGTASGVTPNADTGAESDWGAALAEQAAVEQPGPSIKKDKPGPTASVKKAAFEDFQDEGRTGSEEVNLEVILDLPVTIAMEIGRTRIPIRNLLQLNQGSVVELDRLAGEPLDVLVNGTLIAHGEVVVVNEKFGIRLTDVISPAERVKKLK